MASQLDTLKTLLQSTQLSTSNPRLFQFLNQSIDFLRGIEAKINARIDAANTVTKNATFLTATSELATLPNSRELVAGTNISFDDTVSGIRTANVPTQGVNALLDGVNHIDTVAKTVTRGALVVGNSTPKWDKLIIGAANRVLFSDSIDAAWAQIDLSTSVITNRLPFSHLAAASAASKLVGRGAASGAGDFEEISLGTNISISGTTINVPTMTTAPGGASGDIQYNNAGAFDGSQLRQPTGDTLEHQFGTTPVIFHSYKTLSGGDYERLTERHNTVDYFGEAVHSFVAEKGGTGANIGIELASLGSISMRIPGAFPVIMLYHDPTSNGGISLIPNGFSQIGVIFCDQSGSVMQTPGGFAVPQMIDLLLASSKALLIGDTPSGADFTNRYLAFNTSAASIEMSKLLDLKVGQIKFPATQNPSSDGNTLDDYEEGTWTPTIGGTTSESGQVYAVQSGQYIKVGKLVIAWAAIQLSTLGTITGNVIFKSLPFTVENVTTGAFATSSVFWAALTTAYIIMQANVVVNTTTAFLLSLTAAGTGLTGQPVQADLTANTILRTCFIYKATA